MKTFFSNVEQVRVILTKQQDNFSVFALVKLKIYKKKWDIIVCADWLPQRKKEAIEMIVKQLKETLTEVEFLKVSGVVVLDRNEDFIKELYALEQDSKEYKNIIISSLSIKKLHVLQMIPIVHIEGNFVDAEAAQKFIAECKQICNLDNIEYIEYKNNPANDYDYNLTEHYHV